MIASKKNIIILLALVLVLAIGIYFAIGYKPQNNEQASDGEKTEYITAFEKDENTLSKVTVTTKSESFTFEREGEYDFVANSNEAIILRNSSVSLLFSEVSTVMAEKEVEKGAEDLSQYSLDNPEGVINAFFADGEYVFKVGGKTTEGTGFLMINNDVYLVSASKLDSFLNVLSYYREKNILDVDTTALSKISYKNDTEVVTLEKAKDTDDWSITSPINEKGDYSAIAENIFSQIGNLSINNFVNDTGEAYQKYGIGEKYVYLEDVNGDKQKIFVGNKEDGEYYIKTENNKCVYTAAADSLSFMDLRAVDYTNKFVALINIKDISDVEISDFTQNKKYKLSVSFGEKEVYKIDGVEVLKEKFTDAYQKIIGIMIDDIVTNVSLGEKQYSIKYNMLDKSIKTVDFYTYKDRKHIAVADNKFTYTVLSGDIGDMITALEKASGK